MKSSDSLDLNLRYVEGQSQGALSDLFQQKSATDSLCSSIRNSKLKFSF